MLFNDECKDFIKLIKKHFEYLFKEYKFDVVHSSSARGGEHCLVVLESKDCRIKFYRSQGEVNILFGTLLSPIGWEDVINKYRYWYYASAIINFITKTPVGTANIFSKVHASRTEEEQIKELSEKLYPICEDVIQLFRQDNFGKWLFEYELFEEKQNVVIRKHLERLS
jgi:hypothetical protein